MLSRNDVTTVLKKMCSYVGADYDAMEFKKSDWYLDYTWTREQEVEFLEWLVKFLIKKGASKKHAESEASMFVLSYGWRTK